MNGKKTNNIRRTLFLRVLAVVLFLAVPTVALLVVSAVNRGNEAAYTSAMRVAVPASIALLAAGVAVALFVTDRFGRRVARTVDDISSALGALKNGNLDFHLDGADTGGELGQIAVSLTEFASEQRGAIREMVAALEHLTAQDLSYRPDYGWRGEWLKVGSALDHIRKALTALALNVREAADQTASGSDQVASGSQALAQGATEQASSIEELSATVAEISEHVKKNAANAAEANRASSEEEKKLEDASVEMTEMTKAMQNISETSTQIGNIIKTIDDIAFQTNILALNAAVEAARAGEAGKGFAVVADEVRNLASKSAEAAKNTTDLIENAIKAVGNGSKVANSTEKTLTEVMEAASHANELIEEIAKASGRQATSIGQITQGVQQISAVVQTNSATAEQSAAASEELAAQAKALERLLAAIKLEEKEPAQAKKTTPQQSAAPQARRPAVSAAVKAPAPAPAKAPRAKASAVPAAPKAKAALAAAADDKYV